MFDIIPTPNAVYARIGALLLLSVFSGLPAGAQPSQSPLLAAQSGAKPNLMISLDNSGSMAFSFHESYGVVSDSDAQIELRRCRDTDWSDLTGTRILGGIADFTNGNRCIFRSGGDLLYSTTRSLAYSPPRYVRGSWSAQRSSDVNPLYYNPRTTYLPRVGANGNPLTPNDGIVWISNQASAPFDYSVSRNSAGEIVTSHSMYASNPAALPTSVYSIGYLWRIPQHVTYTTELAASSGTFTYATCSNVTTWDGLQMGCASPVNVSITYGSSANVTLPSGHRRTDCTGNANANTCTNRQEVDNIMNWYRYYAFRAPAVATAIGQAIARDENDGNIRLGYLSINKRNGSSISAIDVTPGAETTTTADPGLLRGVRLHDKSSTDPQRLADVQRVFTWLYDQDGTQNRTSNRGSDATFRSTTRRQHAPYGGTPLHNAIDKVASYYRVNNSGARENPWTSNPAALPSTTNPEMTCRRSFNLLFSDGAWTSNSSTNAGSDQDNTNGPVFTSSTGGMFNYQRTGNSNALKSYTPFPSTGTGGLADLTANYFWHIDFRGGLANSVQTRAGQPAFWQNMATYTVGYQIRPSGEQLGATSGLTFDQIRNYQRQYAANGYASSATPKPTWPTGALNTSATEGQRVDDFIQAGYTGGGRGFSAQTADDVRSIFDTIISEILTASGRDAGVAVSADANLTTIEGSLKYVVNYRTLDNSGEVSAQRLDARGNVVDSAGNVNPTAIQWTASEGMPSYDQRNVFTMSGLNSPQNFAGSLSSQQPDVQAALRAGPNAARLPTDSSFIDYLRGRDPVVDANNVLFRQRTSKLGAMVNPPSIYMGGERDFAYDLASTVDGRNSYLAYATAKRTLPTSLFVATNAGAMHALNATTGVELAAYMPRRSLRRMLNYADAAYNFEYTLDGPLSEHDIYDGTNWNHMAVGTGGRGEPLIYAVRSPLNQTTTPNRTPSQQDFRWETGPDLINDSGPDANGGRVDMGYITNPVRSGQTIGGAWVVVVNNGHYNGQTNGSRAGLVVLNANTGAKLRTIPLPTGFDAGRGLSGVTLVRNTDKRIVAAYAGDTNGNLWRFDLRGSPSDWRVSYNRPLFTTANNRPIYGSPAWQAHPNGGNVVVVATGILLQDSDLGDTAVNESIYGIWDPTTTGAADESSFTTVSTSQLLEQSVAQSTAVVSGGNTFFQATRNRPNWTVHRGWRLPLGHTYAGERSIDQIRNLGKSVLINTTVLSQPSDPNVEMCSASNLPANYIYSLNAVDGASTRSFDTDGDGRLDDVAVVLLSGGGYSRGMAVADILASNERTAAIRQRFATDISSGESDPTEQPCTPRSVILLGTESGGVRAGQACDIPGWSRNQYQLSRPPSN